MDPRPLAQPGRPDLSLELSDSFLVGIVSLGTQRVQDADGVLVTRHQVLLAWETDLVRPDSSPHVVGRVYSLSSRPRSALQQLAVQWMGGAIAGDLLVEMRPWLGRAALVTISGRWADNDRADEVTSVGPAPGMHTSRKPVSALVFYNVTDGPAPDLPWTFPAATPDYRSIIASSLEHQSMSKDEDVDPDLGATRLSRFKRSASAGTAPRSTASKALKKSQGRPASPEVPASLDIQPDAAPVQRDVREEPAVLEQPVDPRLTPERRASQLDHIRAVVARHAAEQRSRAKAGGKPRKQRDAT